MWVTRNKDGRLFQWRKMPYRNGDEWECEDALQNKLELCSEWFPVVKWESDPMKIAISDVSYIDKLKEQVKKWEHAKKLAKQATWTYGEDLRRFIKMCENFDEFADEEY